MLTSEILNLVVGMCATFLVGVNLAILYRFWPEPWLSAKVLAVSGLLVYVALSVLYGDPAAWRLYIGAAAVLTDMGAVAGTWSALVKAQASDGVLIAYQRR